MRDDGLQEKDLRKVPALGISHDRLLMRIKDYILIGTAFGSFFWGGIKIVHELDEISSQIKQVPIMQQQISALQNMVVNSRVYRHPHKASDTGRDESQ